MGNAVQSQYNIWSDHFGCCRHLLDFKNGEKYVEGTVDNVHFCFVLLIYHVLCINLFLFVCVSSCTVVLPRLFTSSLKIQLSLSLYAPVTCLLSSPFVTPLTFLSVSVWVNPQAEDDRCLIGFPNRKRLQARAAADEFDDVVEECFGWLWLFSVVSFPRLTIHVYGIEKKEDIVFEIGSGVNWSIIYKIS